MRIATDGLDACTSSCAHREGGFFHGKVRRKGSGESRDRVAQIETRNAEERIGQEGDEPQTGDRDRTVGSATRRRQGAVEEGGVVEEGFVIEEVHVKEVVEQESIVKEGNVEKVVIEEVIIEEIVIEEVFEEITLTRVGP
jgi:hypothetical protein